MKYSLLVLALIAVNSFGLELKSKDLKEGGTIAEESVYNSFGCSGGNLAPELHWSKAPKETKGYALTVYDPDAPTGSGFWHWVVVDIPAKTTSFKKGTKLASAGSGKGIPSDYGITEYGGPCPPPGKPHSYIFTIHALNTDKLGVPEGATNAVARFFINGATIEKASLTATYERKAVEAGKH